MGSGGNSWSDWQPDIGDWDLVGGRLGYSGGMFNIAGIPLPERGIREGACGYCGEEGGMGIGDRWIGIIRCEHKCKDISEKV